jgi:signal transduction histidine kinase/CheY-like chemotaxis protein
MTDQPAHSQDPGPSATADELRRALKFANDRLGLILRLSGEVLGARSITANPLHLAEQVRNAFGVDACIVRRLEGDQLLLLVGAGVDEGKLAVRLPANQGIAQHMISRREGFIVEDAELHPATAPLFAAAKGDPSKFQFRSFAGVPMLAGREVKGILGIYSDGPVRIFTEDELKHLQVLANHIAVAVENERLFEALRGRTHQLEDEIRERRLIEEELRRSQALLEQRVAERTSELREANDQLRMEVRERLRTEADLRDALLAANAATRAKAEFLANMSHEIRTPLNAVLGMGELMLETTLTDDQREMCETINSSGRGLLTVINDILDFSKLEAGKVSIEAIGFDLHHAVNEVVRILRQAANEKSLRFEAEFSSEVPNRVIGDGTRLRQVLLNLCSNAIKFTQKGEVRLRVNRWGVGGSDIHLLFEVRDTGIGIPPARRDRLFQPFSQIETSTARRFTGTGLGLVISRRLVELMGGEIGVESEEGAGSRFWFLLPVRPTAVISHEEEVGRRLQELSANVPEGKRILLVEDNRVNQVVVMKTLRKAGLINVDLAADGVEALAKATSFRYDLILMDCHIPLKDGYEVTRELRKQESAGARCPIIALTASALDGDREACLQAGMDDYLAKPVGPGELVRAVSKHLAPPRTVGTSAVPGIRE